MAESERFLSVDDEDLEALLHNKDSKNTKTCIKVEKDTMGQKKLVNEFF